MGQRRSTSQLLRQSTPTFLRRAVTRARFGDLRRVQPLSTWGSARGVPIDRWYIERYLRERSDLVHGHALEVLEDLYGSRFGATSIDIVDIDVHNPRATIVGDLCAATTLPPQRFDVAIVTQTLQLLARPVDAVRNILTALRPGGALLVTVPTVSRLAGSADRWRWTPLGLREALAEAAPADADVESSGLGNGLAARAFLFGLAVRDLDDDVLQHDDADYPLVVGGCVRLP